MVREEMSYLERPGESMSIGKPTLRTVLNTTDMPIYKDRVTVPIYFAAINDTFDINVAPEKEFLFDSKTRIILENLWKGIKKGRPDIGISKAFKKWLVKYQFEQGGIPEAIAIAPGAWVPLEVIYEGNGEKWLAKRIRNYKVARGTKQRVETYEDEIVDALEMRLMETDGLVQHYDDGAGSGRGPIKAAKRLLEKDGDLKGRLKLKLVDRDALAVEFMKKYANNEGVSAIVEPVLYDTNDFSWRESPDTFDTYGPHGRLDYYMTSEDIPPRSPMISKQTKREFLEEKSALLKPGGIVIASNMLKNDDKEGMWNLEGPGGWVMDLTWPGQLGQIMGTCKYDSGSKTFDVKKRIIVTPEGSFEISEEDGIIEDPGMGVHELIVARKNPYSPIEI